MSYNVYQEMQKSTAAPRDIEYLAFTEATRRLMEVSEKGREDLKSLIDAIHFNRQLWGALANDCASDENKLPEEVRARIISLSKWVSEHSSAVMREKESLAPLINVNKSMMDGLSGKAP